MAWGQWVDPMAGNEVKRRQRFGLGDETARSDARQEAVRIDGGAGVSSDGTRFAMAGRLFQGTWNQPSSIRERKNLHAVDQTPITELVAYIYIYIYIYICIYTHMCTDVSAVSFLARGQGEASEDLAVGESGLAEIFTARVI